MLSVNHIPYQLKLFNIHAFNNIQVHCNFKHYKFTIKSAQPKQKTIIVSRRNKSIGKAIFFVVKR